MRRREFIALIGGAPVAWPLAAQAQRVKNPIRLGFLPLGSPSNTVDRSLVEVFRQGLRQAGLVENRDIVLDVVWISDNPDQAVTDLMQRGAELLIPCGSSASVAAKRHAGIIPIVFINVGNPIAMGLVESLSHPGHNATGFSDMLADLSGKFVDLARELSKPQGTVDYLWHTRWPDGQNRHQLTVQAAQAAGVNLRSRGVADVAELDDAIAEMKKNGATTLILQPSPFMNQNRNRLIDFAMVNGLATILSNPEFAREGALIGYGPDRAHMYRRAAFYVDRIIKGTKPADLPVEQPTKIELVINLKTAKAIGVEMPLSLLIRADELIE